jgi:hypothetical protein
LLKEDHVKPLRASFAVVAAIAAVLAATAVAATSTKTNDPVAGAAGGGAAVVLMPGVVDTRISRVQTLLKDAGEAVDMGDQAKAVTALAALRSNLTKAWNGAHYIIVNAPPPVAAAGGFRHVAMYKGLKVPARTAGGLIAGASPYADQFATAAAVLYLQHQVAVAAMGMMDLAATPLLSALNTTMFAALNARDAAIEYIHTIPPPPAAAGGVPAGAAGAPIAAGGWGPTMQPLLFDIDDELTQVDVMRTTVNLSPNRKHLLDLAELQATKSTRNINKYWPPTPAAG